MNLVIDRRRNFSLRPELNIRYAFLPNIRPEPNIRSSILPEPDIKSLFLPVPNTSCFFK